VNDAAQGGNTHGLLAAVADAKQDFKHVGLAALHELRLALEHFPEHDQPVLEQLFVLRHNH
jgi:hypothetical protein